MLKSEAFGRSYMAYVLADHTKFDWVSPVSFAPIEKACIITDYLSDESYRSFTIIEEVCAPRGRPQAVDVGQLGGVPHPPGPAAGEIL